MREETAAQAGVEITLKLFATLTDYLPQELDGRQRRYNELPVTVGADVTLEALLERFRVPAKMAHLVLLNGVFVPREARAQRTLHAGDTVAVWPPIAGG